MKNYLITCKQPGYHLREDVLTTHVNGINRSSYQWQAAMLGGVPSRKTGPGSFPQVHSWCLQQANIDLNKIISFCPIFFAVSSEIMKHKLKHMSPAHSRQQDPHSNVLEERLK